ncbi:hypothetical protein B296_00007428, partial [Ensete ventricosum]
DVGEAGIQGGGASVIRGGGASVIRGAGSDVYSYGMMVLEMVGGRKNIKACADDGTSAVYFPHWIYQYLDGGEDDLRAGDVTAETEEIPRKMMLVGLCIQTAPPNRPCMSRVAEMLENTT